MHLRLTWTVALVALAAGAALRPGVLSGDTGRLLITFLGLVSASLLPTISLILGSMTASGRSVKAIDELSAELSAAMDALFALFGFVGKAVAALLALSIHVPFKLANIPFVQGGLGRLGQGILVMAAALIMIRIGQIPAILRRALAIRQEIAINEARRKTLENAPPIGSMAKAFGTHPDFGSNVELDELQRREPH